MKNWHKNGKAELQSRDKIISTHHQSWQITLRNNLNFPEYFRFNNLYRSRIVCLYLCNDKIVRSIIITLTSVFVYKRTKETIHMDFQNIISLVGGFGPIQLFNLVILFTKVPVQSQGSERLCIYVLGVSCLPSFFHLNILELFQ